MKKIFKLTAFFISSTLFFYQCSNEKAEVEKVVQEIVTINGSDTEYLMVQELCDAYSAISDLKFEVSGEGTQKGIEAFISGKADIANCSRPFSDYEIDMAEENKIDPVEVIIAMDAIAFISHPHNPIDSLSTIEIKSILSGEINNWKQLGGPDKKINFYGRNENSGTYKFLENRFVYNEGFSEEFNKLESNQEILEAVQKDTFSLGYVGVGFLTDETGKPNSDIWAMYLYTEGDVEAYSPYEYSAVVSGDYPLVRPLYQYFNGIPTGWLHDFLFFELSFEGQEIVKRHGFFPITSKEEFENRERGIVIEI